MSIFDATTPLQPTAEQGAIRIKRTLAQSFQQIENALAQIRQIVDRHGPQSIRTALGSDATQSAQLYVALKTLVENHKPGASVPDLPE